MRLIKTLLLFSNLLILPGCGNPQFMQGKTTPYDVVSGKSAIILKQPQAMGFSLDQGHLTQCSLIKEHVEAFHRDYLSLTELTDYTCEALPDVNETKEGITSQGLVVRSTFKITRIDKVAEFALDRICEKQTDYVGEKILNSCTAKVKRMVNGKVGDDWTPIAGEKIIAVNIQHLAATLDAWLSKSENIETAWTCEEKGRNFKSLQEGCLIEKPVVVELVGENKLSTTITDQNNEIKKAIKVLTNSYYEKILKPEGVILDDSEEVQEIAQQEKSAKNRQLKAFSYKHTFTLPSRDAFHKERSLTLTNYFSLVFIDKQIVYMKIEVLKEKNNAKGLMQWNPELKDENVLTPQLTHYLATLKEYVNYSKEATTDPLKKDPVKITPKDLFLSLFPNTIDLNAVKEKNLTGLDFYKEIKNSRCHKSADFRGCMEEDKKIFMYYGTFKGFNFSNSAFINIPLEGVNFEESTFKSSKFRGISSSEKLDLRGANFTKAQLENVEFKNVLFDKTTKFSFEKMSGCTCVNCDGVDVLPGLDLNKMQVLD